MIFVCPNGELVDTKTGIVVGYSDFDQFPPLSQDARTLLRHFDGMSAEPLEGRVPKIITLGKEEQRLLGRLRPGKFCREAVRQDYERMIDKINKQQLKIYRTIWMKKIWDDPNSFVHTVEYRTAFLRSMRSTKYRNNMSEIMILARADLSTKYHTPEFFRLLSLNATNTWAREDSPYRTAEYSEKKRRAMKEHWEDPDSIFNSEDYRNNLSAGRKRYCNSSEGRAKARLRNKIRYSNPRERLRSGIAMRRFHAWKKLADVFTMLFSSPG